MAARIKTPAEIAAMREGGRMLAAVLKELQKRTQPGLSPQDMSEIAKRELRALGGEPAFFGFHGYPDIICISVNDQVQHSIPTDRPFQIGDVVNYDFGVRYKDMVTDGGITVCVGSPSHDAQRLIAATQQALEAGLAVIKDGCRVGDVSAAIERVLRHHKLGIVRELVGHGVGYALHEEPEIPNYGIAGKGPVLRQGMTIAVEPITTLGSPKIMQLADGWTLVTQDGSWSAQFEHTVLITQRGCEILTTL